MSRRSVPLFLFLLIAALLLITGCSAIPASIPTSTPEVVLATQTPSPTMETPEIQDEIDSLVPIVVWLPPQFDPDQNTPASKLLKDRLETFNLEHSHLAISYRVKQDTGPAGLLDTLEKTSKVAPQSLPDLVLFPFSELYNAASHSLIYPYPTNIPADDLAGWYRVADDIGMTQELFYGLPMAADAIIMVYNTRLVETRPANWDDLLRSGYTFSFPAGDPEAAYTLGLYLSENEITSNQDGKISIDEDGLAAVLGFYSQASSENLLPPDPTEIKTDQQSWSAFINGNRLVTTTWASRYLGLTDPNLQAAPLLTNGGSPFTLIQGWGWALANPDPNKQVAAAELARYLTEPEFVGQWTEAEGLLPFRPDALTYWQEDIHRALASQLLPAATPFPPMETRDLIAPIFLQAVSRVLTGDLAPSEAAQQAASALSE